MSTPELRTPGTNHTPGPWELVRMDRAERYDIGVSRNRPGFRLVASVDFGFTEPAESEQHANAWLLVSAPDLLAALKELLAAQLTIMPPFEAGKDAQDAWADRQAKARNDAAFVISKAQKSARPEFEYPSEASMIRDNGDPR